ncbi:unnamed protein product [Rhizoctonia solani]|uniref:HNH nuclease domain-containing protein n=1 Tax=Rhizoctonia solani TaxID=456999 RepID=A0A8H2ZZK9_9AGAM|nr:unnamed protein product [Rhizoctonia solani]
MGSLFEGNETARNAYSRLLPLEYQNPLYIRVLGQMIIQAPSQEGFTYIVASINDCTNADDIVALGELHLNHFVQYFKPESKPSRTPSTHPSQPLFEIIQQTITHLLNVAPTDHSRAKKLALIRDNYRCMFSGAVDDKYLREVPRFADEVQQGNVAVKITQCCHILPQKISLRRDTETRRQEVARIWAILHMYGGIQPHELNGTGIHRLSNILTLEVGLHFCFDNLQIWLEPTGIENQYSIARREEYYSPELPAVVTFATSTQYPLPDPRYLALHAACARIIKLSGAAEYVEKILRDAEEVKALSEDKSSSQLPCSLLPTELVTA